MARVERVGRLCMVMIRLDWVGWRNWVIEEVLGKLGFECDWTWLYLIELVIRFG